MEQPADHVAGREDHHHGDPDANAPARPHLFRPGTEPAADSTQQPAPSTNTGHDEHGQVGRRQLSERQRDPQDRGWVDDHDANRREEVGGQPSVDSRVRTSQEERDAQHHLQGHRDQPERQHRASW
jgi:hypothetical protein